MDGVCPLDGRLANQLSFRWTACETATRTPPRAVRPCLTDSVYKVVLQKSIPAQIWRRILYISIYKG